LSTNLRHSPATSLRRGLPVYQSQERLVYQSQTKPGYLSQDRPACSSLRIGLSVNLGSGLSSRIRLCPPNSGSVCLPISDCACLPISSWHYLKFQAGPILLVSGSGQVRSGSLTATFHQESWHLIVWWQPSVSKEPLLFGYTSDKKSEIVWLSVNTARYNQPSLTLSELFLYILNLHNVVRYRCPVRPLDVR
jgi:hypothetical protein